MRPLPAMIAVAVAGCLTAPSFGWSAHGHRTIAYLALDGLPADAPAFLSDPMVRAMVAEAANTPDRWRGTRLAALSHENNPDHFLDVEQLSQFGLTLGSVPPLRREYVKAMAVAKHVHPENVEPYNAAKDLNAEYEYPGFVLHAIAEHYAKLRAAMNELRVLEAIDDPRRAHQVALAQAQVIHEMGQLAHFVGDAAQPLHTTIHHHGWVGENPNGYTTERGFHAYIDGTIVTHHGVTYASLKDRVAFERHVNKDDPWADAEAYLGRSFELVDPLYALQKSGELEGERGKEFIEGRFLDAASMLAAMYRAAWEHAEPTDEDVQSFLKYNDFDPEKLPWTPGEARTREGGK